MWRKLLAAVHPDRNGDEELFVWVNETLRKEVHDRGEQGSNPQREAELFQQATGMTIPEGVWKSMTMGGR